MLLLLLLLLLLLVTDKNKTIIKLLLLRFTLGHSQPQRLGFPLYMPLTIH